MKRIIILLLSFWVVLGSTAYAKCRQGDVKGYWSIYFGVGTIVARCTLRAPNIQNGSSCYLPGLVSNIPLTGYLSLSSNCHVSGNLTIGPSLLTIDGWISRDKETISGFAWDAPNSIGAVFSGVKL